MPFTTGMLGRRAGGRCLAPGHATLRCQPMAEAPHDRLPAVAVSTSSWPGRSAVTLPGAIISRAHTDLPNPILALIFGLAIVGAAFLLSWAAEVAQLDISAGLAIAVLAFIAVLPEYAVDLVFALNGGEAYKEFGVACQSAAEAAAGPGVGLRPRPGQHDRRQPAAHRPGLDDGGVHRLAPATRRAASGWRASSSSAPTPSSCRSCRSPPSTRSPCPLKSSITLIDSVVLVSMFVLYMVRISKAPAEEPHLVGPAEAWASSPRRSGGRRWSGCSCSPR